MKHYFKLIAALLVLTLFAGKANAQDSPPLGTAVIKLTTTTTGAPVRMRMVAAADNTPVWIQTGPNAYISITVGTNWTGTTSYAPTSGTSINVHGAITGFDCSGSDTNINPVSALDASGNTGLQQLYCSYNPLQSLTVSGLTQLQVLYCYNNWLQSLSVSGLTQLKTLRCNNNRLTSLDISGLTQLQTLQCSYNPLQILDVSGLNQLQELYCYFNQLSNLNVQGLTQLKILSCSNNYHLQSLNVSGLTQLKHLNCFNNRLTSLNVSGLTQLQSLYCNNNQLQSLNVSGLTQLKYLYCYNNRLTSLDVPGLTQLRELYCFGNPCTSTTFGLDQIYCQLPERLQSDDARIYVSGQAQSNLEAFVLATNGSNASSNNWKLYGYDLETDNEYQITNTTGKYVCGNPPNLPVIKLTTTTAGASVQLSVRAATDDTPVWIETAPGTYIFVTVRPGWTVPTSYTPTDTSLKVYGAITGFDCRGESDANTNPVSVLDASGNTDLQQLHCYNNQLTSLNVSGLTQLQALYCDNNRLTNLDVSGLTQLKSLLCHNNQLQSLNVSGLTQLQILGCFNNQLQSLIVSGLTQLKKLDCHSNQLKSLNVSGLNQLQDLYCNNNQLTSLIVSGLTQLKDLNCNTNRLTSLNVSGLTQLQLLNCYTNRLTSLDVSGTQLQYLLCSNNQLQSLNVSGLTQLHELECFNNPCTSTTFGLDQIYCQLPERQQGNDGIIYVSGQAEANLEAFVLATNGNNASIKHWKLYGYDLGNYSMYQITNTTGSYVCDNPPNLPVITLTTTTADAVVRMKMTAATADTPVWIETAPGTYIPVTVGTGWTSYTNYTPIGTSLKVYGAITGFWCNGESESNTNPVSALDASGNTGLQQLHCYNNQLTSLNVSGLTQLQELDCYNNLLQSLDVSGLTQLKYLTCNNNQLKSLNVSGLTQLQQLICAYNQLQSLSVSGLTQLKGLYCYNNLLTNLDVSGLTQLKGLNCSNNLLQSLNVSGLTQLKLLGCFGNPCTSTTFGLDQIYCQLPVRLPEDDAKIYVSGQAQAAVEAFVLATNGSNAIGKHWKLYGYDLATETEYQITNTAGNYVCGTYPLWVGGVQVTEDNASNITGSGISGGTGAVSYNPATKTLTLNNAAITGVYETRNNTYNSITQSSIRADMDILKINLIGTNSIKLKLNTMVSGYNRYSGYGIDGNKYVGLIGNGSLNIDVSVTGNGSTTHSAYSCGIEAATYLSEPAELFIAKDVSLEVSTQATGATYTSKYALTCDTEVSPNIENQSQRVIKEGNDAASATQVTSLTMWDNTSTNQSKPYVKIERASVNYGIKIAGTDLTSANAGAINNTNFPNLGLAEGGTITYDHSAKTITLNGVNVNTYTYFIEISDSAIDDEYKIKLVNNNIVTTNASSIFTKKSLTIEGSGSLKATSNNGAAIELYFSNLTLKIKNTTVEAIGKWGIAGNNGRGGETLIIENSTVRAAGGSGGGSIMDFQTITFNGCAITQPAGAAVAANGTNGMAVMKDGLVVISQVVITPTIPATVTTDDATALSATSATLNGTVSPGTDEIAERGFEWKKTTGGTYADLVYTGTDNTFSANLTGLFGGTSYTYRAYVKVGTDKVYGSEKTFTTSTTTVTTATTNPATDITQNSATLNGVINQGSGAVVEKGFEWKLTSGGTYTGIVSNSTENNFTATLTGLTANTSYTFKAYIKIRSGSRFITRYGEEETFTTSAIPATVTTIDATAISVTSATLNGTVNPGTDVIGEKGFEWKMTEGGTYADLVSAGTDNTYTADLTGLTANTSYTFRAYVKVGTDKVYGAYKTFTTIVTDIEYITQTLGIYPNPASNFITITTDEIGSVITITDLSGRAVMTATATDSKTTLNVSELSAGTYIVRVGERVAKVVKAL